MVKINRLEKAAKVWNMQHTSKDVVEAFKLYPLRDPRRVRDALWAMWVVWEAINLGAELDSETVDLNVRLNEYQQIFASCFAAPDAPDMSSPFELSTAANHIVLIPASEFYQTVDFEFEDVETVAAIFQVLETMIGTPPGKPGLFFFAMNTPEIRRFDCRVAIRHFLEAEERLHRIRHAGQGYSASKSTRKLLG